MVSERRRHDRRRHDRRAARLRLVAYLFLASAVTTSFFLFATNIDRHRSHDTERLRAQAVALRDFQLAKCRTDNTVRTNQRVVLSVSLAILRLLHDRPSAGLNPVPRMLVKRLEARLTPLHAPYPDVDCDGTPDPPK